MRLLGEVFSLIRAYEKADFAFIREVEDMVCLLNPFKEKALSLLEPPENVTFVNGELLLAPPSASPPNN
jgi:hypothetical protein